MSPQLSSPVGLLFLLGLSFQQEILTQNLKSLHYIRVNCRSTGQVKKFLLPEKSSSHPGHTLAQVSVSNSAILQHSGEKLHNALRMASHAWRSWPRNTWRQQGFEAISFHLSDECIYLSPSKSPALPHLSK